MSPLPVVWEETFSARSYEIEPGHRAGVRTVCNWLQEAAGNHAQALGWGMEHLIAKGLTWVLSRFHLILHRHPAWREPVRVRTWPAGVQRLWALRDFTIADQVGDVLAVATSAWLQVKVDGLRPARPSQQFSEIASQAPPRSLEDPFQKLPELATTDTQRHFTVRLADLDINRHANNVSVISWLVESAPDYTLLERELREIEVEFRAEILFAEDIVARCQHPGSPDAPFLHSLLRRSDGTEVARARTVWASPPC